MGDRQPRHHGAQLLSNSSGLIGLLQDLAYGPYVCQWDYSQNLQDCAAQIMTTPDDDTDIIAPDTGFNYGGAQFPGRWPKQRRARPGPS